MDSRVKQFKIQQERCERGETTAMRRNNEAPPQPGLIRGQEEQPVASETRPKAARYGTQHEPHQGRKLPVNLEEQMYGKVSIFSTRIEVLSCSSLAARSSSVVAADGSDAASVRLLVLEK